MIVCCLQLVKGWGGGCCRTFFGCILTTNQHLRSKIQGPGVRQTGR